MSECRRDGVDDSVLVLDNDGVVDVWVVVLDTFETAVK